MLKEEKLKIALDTNSIIKYFERMLKFRRGKDDRFIIPSECIFLKNNSDCIDLFISVLNQAEVFRKLKSEWGCSEEDIREMWNEFVQWLPLNIIEEFSITKEVIKITVQFSLKKKTIVNFLHLLVAKEYGLWFYTGDKEIAEKGEKFYNKIVTYKKLKNLIEKSKTKEGQPACNLLIILSNLGPILSKNSLVDITRSGTSTLTLLLLNLIILVFILLIKETELFKTFGNRRFPKLRTIVSMFRKKKSVM